MQDAISALSVAVNAALAGGKIAVGALSQSAAVMAEGIHSLMDLVSSSIGYIGIRISRKPEDAKHPYGHYKFEVLAGFIITLILCGTGARLVYGAYRGLLRPRAIALPVLAYWVMAISAVVNEIMARLKIHYGTREDSIALLSDGVHSRIDVWTSAAVFVGIWVSRYWIHADGLLALLIGVYIIQRSFLLGKGAVDSLLDASAGQEIEEKIRSIARGEHIALDSLKTQKRGVAVTANLEIDLPNTLTVEEATAISEALRKRLMSAIRRLSHVAIQIRSHEVETGFFRPSIGHGFGWQRRGGPKGRREETSGQGPGGHCVCPRCGYRAPHRRGVPCAALKCPQCAAPLERSPHEGAGAV